MWTCQNVSSLRCEVSFCDSDLSGSVVLSKISLQSRQGQRDGVLRGAEQRKCMFTGCPSQPGVLSHTVHR